MTNLVKRLVLRFRTAEDIASDYQSYADFAAHASESEKQRLLSEVISKANRMQREVAASNKEFAQH
jgi:hypothetical protein